MRWRVEGVSLDTGDEVDVEVDAAGMVEAANWARQQRIALKPGSPEPVREAPPPTHAAPRPLVPEPSYSDRRSAAKTAVKGPSGWSSARIAAGVWGGMTLWTLTVVGTVFVGAAGLVASRLDRKPALVPTVSAPAQKWVSMRSGERAEGVLLLSASCRTGWPRTVEASITVDNAFEGRSVLLRFGLKDKEGRAIEPRDGRLVFLPNGLTTSQFLLVIPAGVEATGTTVSEVEILVGD